MIDAALARCRFASWAAPGAPEVWALRHSGDAPARPEAGRERMRQAARDALRTRLAAALGVPAAAIAIGQQRGQAPSVRWQPSIPVDDAALAARLSRTALSISHDTGVSLIAWHGAGPVGVDVVRLGVTASANELAHIAALYLEPKSPSALVQQAQSAINNEAILQRWACHEARLKCAGLGLVEWNDALAAALAHIHAVRVKLPPWAGDAVAAVAWRWPLSA
ncbi:MAG: hypothetical protein Q4G71_14075 [Pseudomonadota bacterium]|nr:hypothetical protein [Pseudomonadota bacterium]